jgi:hypothetical protein
MNYSAVSRFHLGTLSLILASSFILTACSGGSSGTDAGTAPTPKPAPPAPPVTPAITDNVLFSLSPASNVIATINKAGYLRSASLDSGTHPLNIALGSAPMTGTAASAVGNGWSPTAGIFARSTVTLTLNPDATTYTLKAQSTSGQASNSAMQVFPNLITPTPATLTGNYGTNPQYVVTVNGNTFTGLFGYECGLSGTLSPNSKTIDITHITFENTKNPTGLACAYAGKEFTGTAFLMGSSDAYPRGVLVVNIDDGGSDMPTMNQLYYFIRP